MRVDVDKGDWPTGASIVPDSITLLLNIVIGLIKNNKKINAER